MTSDNEIANASEEGARGDEALRAAEELLGLNLFNDAVSRAYYAAYHWARALLFTRGLESKTHHGVIQLVGLRFVREGIVPKHAAALLSQLETAREASDYTANAHFTKEEAADAVGRAKAFIDLCRPIVESLPRQQSQPQKG